MFKKLLKKKQPTTYKKEYDTDTLKSILDVLLTTNISFKEKELAIQMYTKDKSYFFHSLLIILLEYTRTGIQKQIIDGLITQEDYYLTPTEFRYLLSRLLVVLSTDKDDNGSELFITFIGILILSRSSLISTQLLSHILKEVSSEHNIEKEHVCKILDEVINMFFYKDTVDEETSEKLKDALENFIH